MSSKVKRKVTVESSKDNSDQPRRPSVFERLGPGTLNLPSQSQDRHARVDHNEKCRNWLRTGSCVYGSSCRYQHDTFLSSSKRSLKIEKDIDEKDLRHKVRKQRDEQKESRTGSLSPKRKSSKRSGSRSRKGEHESKIKSTVVVTRPRSPLGSGAITEGGEKEKKKGDGGWDEDSDDWPIDAAQLDYKEELTLERKRQQLQRELELEIQKERMLNVNPNVTKTVSFSESSSSSSSSDSGSISSSSDSSSSSSEEDSDDSSSSSSSTSSSASQAPAKKKSKKPAKKESAAPKLSDTSAHRKPLDDYNKIKSSRAAKSENLRTSSSTRRNTSKKRGGDRKNASPLPISSPKVRGAHDLMGKSGSHVRKGPRTPSPPPPSRKQRQWTQSSSADSRSADVRRNRGKRHKKKKDSSKNERYKSDYVPTPPRLSSPNRTVLQQPHLAVGKKVWPREELGSKSQLKNKDNSPMYHSRMSGSFTSSPMDHISSNSFYPEVDKPSEKHKSKNRSHKSEDGHSRKGSSRNHKSQRHRQSPAKDSRQSSISPQQERYEVEQGGKKLYSSSALPSSEKSRRRSASPSRHDKDRSKSSGEGEKRRDKRDSLPPDSRIHSHPYGKKEEPRVKQLLSPDVKKGREEKGKDRSLKDRSEQEWNDDHKKELRIPDSRSGRLELPAPQQASSSLRKDRSRERDRERKKGKERDALPLRENIERDRSRLTPPHRVAPDIHKHHPLRDEPPVPVPRAHLYEPDLPPDERDYPYVYAAHHEPAYIDERVLPPDYDPDLLQVPPLYPPEAGNYTAVYADARYRRDVALKEPPHMERIVGYGGRDMSPLDRHEPVVLPVRDEDYLDLPLDDRRAYEERWGRNLPLRDDWDPYSPLPPAALPPHVAASMDDERYGIPRRRRSSPDWHLRRGERDLSLREPRSRSPQHRRLEENPVSGRGPWREQADRHGNRAADSRNDNPPKPQDDKKSRPPRRDRRDRDRSKKPDEHISESSSKPAVSSKEKSSTKRSRSSTPQRKDAKRRKEDSSAKDDNVSSEKGSSKKTREEQKSDSKSSNSKSSSKSSKTKSVSPKPDEKQSSEKHLRSRSSDKPEAKSSSKQPSKVDGDEKRRRNHDDGKNQVDDEFSDWSDGDDDLLNRDLVESESNNGEKPRNRSDDHRKEKSSGASSESRKDDNKERSSKQKRDGSRDSRIRCHELKSESHSRTGSKERSSSDSSRKQDQPILSAKESDSSEPFVVKDEAVEDPDDFMMTESVDYDPISDGELEALIEEPDDSLSKPADASEETKVVDALDVNWSVLVSEPKPKVVPCSARKRYKAAHVLSRIGFSQAFAGPELSEKIIKFCQKQLDEEKEEEDASGQPEKFQMEHPIAAFHVILKERKKERENAFTCVGPNRRALCARQDLHIRKLLCRPSNKLVATTSTCVQQYGNAESNTELKSMECQPPVINATC